MGGRYHHGREDRELRISFGADVRLVDIISQRIVRFCSCKSWAILMVQLPVEAHFCQKRDHSDWTDRELARGAEESICNERDN